MQNELVISVSVSAAPRALGRVPNIAIGSFSVAGLKALGMNNQEHGHRQWHAGPHTQSGDLRRRRTFICFAIVKARFHRR